MSENLKEAFLGKIDERSFRKRRAGVSGALVDSDALRNGLVSAQQARALEFGDIAAFKRAHPDHVDRIKNYADPAQPGPTVIFKPRPASV